MTRCIAITGNIASGKSSVAQIFKNFGADLISADDISRSLTQPGTEWYDLIQKKFAQHSHNHKPLSRRDIRSIIFNHPADKKWLESLLHPLIRDIIKRSVEKSKNPLVVIEIPLHFDKNDYPYVDRVLWVKSPIEAQIQRIMQRDGHSREECVRILSTQPPDHVRQEMADMVIDNHGSLKNLKDQVNQIINQWNK